MPGAIEALFPFARNRQRDPEDRSVNEQDLFEIREKMLDKMIADSFPASDPPSTDPVPGADSFAQ